MFGLALLSFALGLSFTSAQDANCDFVQYVQAGSVYDLTSPNYPDSYPRGVSCRWIVVCPTGYNCRLDCPVVQLAQTSSCGDRIMISRTGDPLLNGASVVCGNNPFTVVSTQAVLSIALVTSSTSTGGGFKGQVYAQAATTPTPTCICGMRKQNRIVGGQETGVNEYPMMAGIISVKNAIVKCGAVIVSNKYLVTAAHCTVGENINSIAVLVGDHDITTNDTSTARGYRVQSIINHPQYDPSNYNNDVSVVATTTIIEFNSNVSPVCMPFKFTNFDFTGRKLIILGWGTLYIGGPRPNALQQVSVDVISDSSCRASTPSVTSAQICTYTPGKDACQYDSGGPAMYMDPASGRLIFIGIVSSGRACASGAPGINTRVTSVLEWIVTVTGDVFCRV